MLREDADDRCSISTFGGTSPAGAEATRLMRRAATTGSPVDDEDDAKTITYKEFVEGTFASEFMPGYRPATRVRYDALHRQSVMAYFGAKRLDAITLKDIRGFMAELQARGVQARGPVNLVRTVLRAAVSSEFIDDVVALPRGLVKASKTLPEAPSAEEYSVMLKAPGWLGLAVALAGLAGLRMGEVRALEVRDVDLAHGLLILRRALSEDESLTPKDGEERRIPLVPELAERLREATKNKLPRARVVLDEQGRTPTRQRVLHRFKQYLARSNLSERSFHALRHDFASELVRRGASIEAVRTLVGHSSLKMTQRYVHANATDLREAVDRLGR
jgi:integrase